MLTKFIVLTYIVTITCIAILCTMLSKVYGVDVYSNNCTISYKPLNTL